MSDTSVSSSVASSTRRRFLAACSAAGFGGTLLPGVLLGMVGRVEGQGAAGEGLPKITGAMIEGAAGIAGVRVTQEQIAMMLGDGETGGLEEQRGHVERIRGLGIPNAVAPAVVFDPVPGWMRVDAARKAARISKAPGVGGIAIGAGLEGTSDGLAFATVRELAELVRTKKVTSVGLTKMYLERLKRFDPRLHCVITLTEARAMERAAAADGEIAGGRYKGPLHGIPWGAKDLLAVKGYRTTWGAGGFEEQSFDYDAEVVRRLDEAGAVLVAKLSMGALASGDLWFGGRTRNPWNVRQGSSGSSAGSASAVAAGCVGFAIGTETLGSISSPSTRCGVTGLRPSFGLVPRTGAMALTWSMDKIGPICRSVEDCAMVLSAIYGPDGKDLSVKDASFNWDAEFDWKTLRVGYFKAAFEAPKADEEEKEPVGATAAEMEAYRGRVAGRREFLARQSYDLKYNVAAVEKLRAMGVALIPVEMPKFPFGSIVPVLEAEAAAAFDELTRSGQDGLLTGQKAGDWPNTFRVARFYSAVDYVQAMRARTLAVGLMAELFKTVDVIVTPSSGTQLSATNLTGQPAVIVPNGVRGEDAPVPRVTEDGAAENVGGPGTPVSLTFLGALYSDARVASFARAYQEATGFHRLRPGLA
ncbi:amidase [Granulicella sibirica]|uniref:Glutamyl-tRNA(Gln) amidotransferase subunit A-like protein n=1 Tax=Granulicella sibirica TaxID=2479048 RepID=A0A4Q0T785_9BACT|nr:amidase [Granulicella sibirica]RXH57968.1 Glutamyl-tRNA(Gln) amidotransferase subunit A-like protein [Granulicella sibirica]